MKTRLWRRLFAATFISFAVAARAAENDEPKPAVAPAEDTAAKAPATLATNAPAVLQPQPDTGTTPVAVIPPKLSLPPMLDQVVRLSQSGADESVIRAYVEKAAPAYRITGNEIIQLQDLGVSKGVILSLVEHSKTAVESETAVAPAPAPAAPIATNLPPPESDENVNDYYEALAPYGSWSYLADYGWCWQPSVVVVNPGWRPYCDNGYWQWSDSGWYWNSYYSWGWAPFHYGRWFCHGNGGWYWYPDRVWGPSWVCWRNSTTHCGWAPLPPGSCFTAGVGWTHHGASVGVGFGFGIASAHFNFVSHDHFTDHHVGKHTLHGHAANIAYGQSKVINNYGVGANNRVFNHGVGREQVAAARGAPLQTVSVSESARHGNALSRGASAATISGNGVGATRQVAFQQSRSATASVAPRSAPSTATFGASQRAMPNYSVPNRTPAQQSRSTYAAGAQRSYAAATPRVNTMPQTVLARSYASANRNTVAPRTFSSPGVAQRQFSPQASAARPSVQRAAPSVQTRAPSFGGGNVSRGSASVGRSSGGGSGISVGRSGSAGRR